MPRRARLYIGRRLISKPSNMTWPPSGTTMPMTMRKVVVFPGSVAAEHSLDHFAVAYIANDDAVDDSVGRT